MTRTPTASTNPIKVAGGEGTLLDKASATLARRPPLAQALRIARGGAIPRRRLAIAANVVGEP